MLINIMEVEEVLCTVHCVTDLLFYFLDMQIMVITCLVK